MRPLELTRGGVLGTVAVFTVALVCVRLGFWQLDRRAQRLELNAAVAARLAAEPVALTELPTDTAGLTYRRAEVRGALDHDHTVVLAGRSRAGQPGVHVLSPVRLGPGAVLVNRGWVPAPDAATIDLDQVRRPEPARFSGVLVPFPDSRGEPGEEAGFRRTWFRLDGDGIRAQLPYPVPALYLLATAAAEPPDPAGGPVPLDPPELDAGPHLSYAIQWFSFATIALVGWAALLLTRRAGSGAPARGPDP